jgi:hypothetical protein
MKKTHFNVCILKKFIYKFESNSFLKVMIYHFKIYSQELDNFLLEVSLDGNHTFFNFHTFIQNSLNYESHQLASFFVSDAKWKKLKEISQIDMGLNGGAFLIMRRTKIKELLHSSNQKLIYTFDFINDRSFYIELTGIIMAQNLNEPLVTLKRGNTPVQILGEESYDQETAVLQEEEVFMDFGELNDYNEIFGEMDDF